MAAATTMTVSRAESAELTAEGVRLAGEAVADVVGGGRKRPSTDLEKASGTASVGPPAWYRSLPLYAPGDIDAYVSLFTQNLASLMAGCGMLLPLLGPDIVYDKIMPGVGLAEFFGCVYYSVQALLKSAQTGQMHTAQPFGVNAPGIFAFNASIILPVYFANGANAEAAELAWQVGCMANLIQGLLEIALVPLGPLIAKSIPLVALLGTLSSIGIAFLFTNPLAVVTAAPLTGMVAWAVLLLSMYGGVKVPYIPRNLLPLLAGMAMAWITGLATWSDVAGSWSAVGFHPPMPQLGFLQHYSAGLQYVGTIIPISFTVVFETIQCRELAEQCGDNYSIRWSMFGDGIATVLASLCGCPYGMTIFIGHSAYKDMGAYMGYNLLSGLSLLLVFFSGLGAVLLAAVPTAALSPMVMFVGVAICVESLEAVPRRHWPAFIVALVPAFCDLAVVQAQNFAAAICDHNNGCSMNPRSADGWLQDPQLHGLLLMSQGFLLLSMLYASTFSYILDGRFAAAGVASFASALCASCGLIHAAEVFLPWRGSAEGTATHWKLTFAYTLVGLIFLFTAAVKRTLGDDGEDRQEALQGSKREDGREAESEDGASEA